MEVETPTTTTNPLTKRGRPPKSGKRSLPEDPRDFEREVAIFKPIVKPLVVGLSKVCDYFVDDPLNVAEQGAWEHAGAATLYKYNGAVEPEWMLFSCAVATLVPRGLKWLNEKKKEKQSLPLGAPPAARPPPAPSPNEAVSPAWIQPELSLVNAK